VSLLSKMIGGHVATVVRVEARHAKVVGDDDVWRHRGCERLIVVVVEGGIGQVRRIRPRALAVAHVRPSQSMSMSAVQKMAPLRPQMLVF